MLYISRFEFPDAETETDFRFGLKMTCYDSIYPFGVLSEKGLTQLDFEDITLLCGGNGTGKTTALNIIAEKLKLTRASLYNRSCFFERYLEDCSFICELEITPHSRIITSDDVFDFMLDLRSLNSGVDRRRDELFDEYLSLKHKNQVFVHLRIMRLLSGSTRRAARPLRNLFAGAYRQACANGQTGKAHSCISKTKLRKMRCICWMNPKTVFLRKNRLNCFRLLRTAQGISDASL